MATQLGNALNAGVMKEMKDIKTEQEETRKKLDAHIEEGEERKANNYRSQVLRFNNELVRGLGHTEEDYDEILEVIWKYNEYCKTHPKYKNNKSHMLTRMWSVCTDEMLRTWIFENRRINT